MDNITCCVATFGSYRWQFLAQQRSLPSCYVLGVPVIYIHGDTLHGARNECLKQVETEFIVYCDADDELDSNFLKEIEKFEGDIRVPSVNHVHEGVTFMPRVVGHNHVCISDCLEQGNWICVGAVARTELLREVGGWKDWGTFEDFDLWQRCWLAGAAITPVPRAIYRAYSTPQGRCKSLPVSESTRIQRMICETNMPNLPHLK